MLITTILFTLLVALWGFSGMLLRSAREQRPVHRDARERLRAARRRARSAPARRGPMRTA